MPCGTPVQLIQKIPIEINVNLSSEAIKQFYKLP